MYDSGTMIHIWNNKNSFVAFTPQLCSCLVAISTQERSYEISNILVSAHVHGVINRMALGEGTYDADMMINSISKLGKGKAGFRRLLLKKQLTDIRERNLDLWQFVGGRPCCADGPCCYTRWCAYLCHKWLSTVPKDKTKGSPNMISGIPERILGSTYIWQPHPAAKPGESQERSQRWFRHVLARSSVPELYRISPASMTSAKTSVTVQHYNTGYLMVHFKLGRKCLETRFSR